MVCYCCVGEGGWGSVSCMVRSLRLPTAPSPSQIKHCLYLYTGEDDEYIPERMVCSNVERAVADPIEAIGRFVECAHTRGTTCPNTVQGMDLFAAATEAPEDCKVFGMQVGNAAYFCCEPSVSVHADTVPH